MAGLSDTSDLAVGFSARRAALLAAGAALLGVSVVLIAPAVAHLPSVWQRLAHGDVSWLALAGVLELLSFAGHIVLFRAVSVDGSRRIGLRASTEITFAGHAATRLFASAGAGGVVLTAWALRRGGMARAQVAARMTTFLVLLYSVYMAALIAGGAGLAAGLLPGGGSLAITVVPAAFGAAVIGAALATQRIRPGASRARRLFAPVGAGVRDARRLVRAGNPGLLGALMWWGFDVAVLYACFAAFGAPPPVAVVVVAYFVGTLANTLPLPGGIGGVEGGMVGALAAFGVDPGLAVVAVLSYRVFAFWLPIVPGAVAFASLRRTVAGWAAEDAGRARAPRPAARWPAPAASSIDRMEGFGSFFNDPDFQRRMQEMAEQMQSAQTLAWADNAIKLAVDMTVAAINRINVQGTAEQQAQQIRAVMATVFPEAVTLVREARQGLA